MDNKFIFRIEIPEKLVNIFSILLGYLFVVLDNRFILV